MDADKQAIKTIEVRAPHGWMIKPSELVEVVEMQPLTLYDRKVFNLLLKRARDHIAEDVWHEVETRWLRGSRDKDDRLRQTILKLRSTFINVRTRHHDPTRGVVDAVVENVSLLHETKWSRRRAGLLYYRFSSTMREIITNSRTYAKLKEDIVRSIESKYSLVLYEMVQRRVNLRKTQETFTLEEIRSHLGVPPGKLDSFGNLNLRALQPAAAEVSRRTGYDVGFLPQCRQGTRAVDAVTLYWRPRASASPNVTGLLDVITPQ